MDHRLKRKPAFREESVIVLDYLENSSGRRNQKVIQAIGTGKFSLLEIVPKPDVEIFPEEELYVGEGKREKVHHISGKLTHENLTGHAQGELKFIVEKIVERNEDKYVNFFNKAQAISLRRHSLELLPGLGKRYMLEIVEERREGDFTSFEDIKARVKGVPDPKQSVIKRVMEELQQEEKFYLFVEK